MERESTQKATIAQPDHPSEKSLSASYHPRQPARRPNPFTQFAAHEAITTSTASTTTTMAPPARNGSPSSSSSSGSGSSGNGNSNSNNNNNSSPSRTPPHMRGASSGGVGTMPSIAEDEVSRVAATPPNMPRRVPPRSPRRLSRRSPPPYVPVLHPPPSYKEEKNGGGGGAGAEGTEGRSRAIGFGGGKRRCWCAVVVGALVLVILATGLAVGLAIGLKNKRHPVVAKDPSSPNFPAGSYSFNTTLQQASTACTSNPSTWRCYPFETGQPAIFFWAISQVNSSHYAISTNDNPFALTFTNVTLSRIDMNQPSERLTFSFGIDRTVFPSDPITPDNRAAKCTYKNTTFEATLWTRRDGAEVLGDETLGEQYGPWPGDVEVKQTADSRDGPPSCAYVEGGALIDVRAGKGTCECRYANFEDA